MYRRLIQHDIARSKLISLTTMIFVAAAALLVALAAILVVNLTGSIDTLMTQSKAAHFTQMHSGKVDQARLAAFAESNNDVEAFQLVEFVNMESSRIVIGGSSLAGSVQDNGIAMQNGQFDFLLDLDGRVIEPADGMIYVPVNYMKDGTAKVGDKASIYDKEFTVAGFLRDSQMNSLLASSKRFLVSGNDFLALKNKGNTEYLIEFRLKDLSSLNTFKASYITAGLEANGPTLTYPLFKMLNAISDGMMIGVLLLVSVLVVIIAMMCVRFTLLAKIEDDYREIGVMKAIGLRVSDIKKIYLAKYAVIGAAGSLLGFALSFVFRGRLTENIRLYMGESAHASWAPLIGVIGVLLVFLILVAYVNRVLKRFRRISPSEAIRYGVSQEKTGGARSFRLSRSRLLPTNLFLGVKDVLSRKRLYGTMLAVLVISAFIIIVPQNLAHTISGRGFSTYMGIGDYDLRVDIQQTDRIPAKAADMAQAMEQDSSILQSTVLTTKIFKTKTADGAEDWLKIELGDHTLFPLQFSKGRAPAGEGEIALSVLNANELGKKVGDTVILVISGQEKQLTVSGTYSDITNGGKTAKASFKDDSEAIMWAVIYAKMVDPSQVAAKAAEYGGKYNYAKVSDIQEFTRQTFGSTISSIELASKAALAVALVITVLVTLLFMRMLVAKDRYSIAVMKAFGFTNRDIQLQFLSRSVFVLVIGIVLGTVLANTLGEKLAGAVISSFGAASFKFAVNPLTAYLFSPLLMVCAVLLATIISTSGAGKIQISAHIKE